VLARGLAGQPRLTTHYKKLDRSKDSRWEGVDMDRATDQTDVLIVGGGPAGLCAAIKLKQLSAAAGKEYRVTVVEKAGTPGAHTLSGAVLETRALDELLPNWKELGAPVTTAVTSDSMSILTATMRIPLPVPPRSPMDNHGNYIVRLGNVVAWLAEKVRACARPRRSARRAASRLRAPPPPAPRHARRRRSWAWRSTRATAQSTSFTMSTAPSSVRRPTTLASPRTARPSRPLSAGWNCARVRRCSPRAATAR
jgi:monoamine oxidase